jgi:hypothetical protein
MNKNARRIAIMVAVVVLGFMVILGALAYSLMPGLTALRRQ